MRLRDIGASLRDEKKILRNGMILLGFAGMANMWAAVFADTGVAMICILNSIRILYKK